MLKAAHSESVPFSSPDRLASEGDKQLRQIADAGREWKQTVGRKVDMEGKGSFFVSPSSSKESPLIIYSKAYVYRLCLEFARLYSDDRESMSFSR